MARLLCESLAFGAERAEHGITPWTLQESVHLQQVQLKLVLAALAHLTYDHLEHAVRCSADDVKRVPTPCGRVPVR